MIDHKRKLIFIHISRTGGTSIEYSCVGNDWWHIDSETKHLRCSQARELYWPVWDEYHKFSVVRNPYSRVLSMFACGVWDGDFEGTCFDSLLDRFKVFVTEFGPHPNETYGTVYQNEILDLPLDQILRFESLCTDFSQILPGVALVHADAKKHPKWQDFYDTEAKNLVYDRFDQDFLRFGYAP